jgi:hypothetical protein
MIGFATWLVPVAAAQAALIIGILVWLSRRDDRRRKEVVAAIEFAIGLNLFRQKQFLRLFLDGEQDRLKQDYPEWAEYRTRYPTSEGY